MFVYNSIHLPDWVFTFTFSSCKVLVSSFASGLPLLITDSGNENVLPPENHKRKPANTQGPRLGSRNLPCAVQFRALFSTLSRWELS